MTKQPIYRLFPTSIHIYRSCSHENLPFYHGHPWCPQKYLVYVPVTAEGCVLPQPIGFRCFSWLNLTDFTLFSWLNHVKSHEFTLSFTVCASTRAASGEQMSPRRRKPKILAGALAVWPCHPIDENGRKSVHFCCWPMLILHLGPAFQPAFLLLKTLPLWRKLTSDMCAGATGCISCQDQPVE